MLAPASFLTFGKVNAGPPPLRLTFLGRGVTNFWEKRGEGGSNRMVTHTILVMTRQEWKVMTTQLCLWIKSGLTIVDVDDFLIHIDERSANRFSVILGVRGLYGWRSWNHDAEVSTVPHT